MSFKRKLDVANLVVQSILAALAFFGIIVTWILTNAQITNLRKQFFEESRPFVVVSSDEWGQPRLIYDPNLGKIDVIIKNIGKSATKKLSVGVTYLDNMDTQKSLLINASSTPVEVLYPDESHSVRFNFNGSETLNLMKSKKFYISFKYGFQDECIKYNFPIVIQNINPFTYTLESRDEDSCITKQ